MKIPCENCLVLPICLERFRDAYFNNRYNGYIALDRVSCKCSLLSEYTGGNPIRHHLSKPKFHHRQYDCKIFFIDSTIDEKTQKLCELKKKEMMGKSIFIGKDYKNSWEIDV